MDPPKEDPTHLFDVFAESELYSFVFTKLLLRGRIFKSFLISLVICRSLDSISYCPGLLEVSKDA